MLIRYHEGFTNYNSSISWIKNKIYHHLNRPAIEYTNGCIFWIQNGKYHRLDGPAIEFPNGYKEWWIEGKFIKKIFSQ